MLGTMGCSSSKLEQQEQRALSHNPGRPSRAQTHLMQPNTAPFAGFLSHYKIEAATEARWLKEKLEDSLEASVFLDSDDLRDLSRLKDHVRDSKCIVLLQSATC